MTLSENALYAVSWSEVFPSLEMAEEAIRRIPCEVIPALYPLLLGNLADKAILSWSFLIFGFERHWCFADVFTQFCASKEALVPAGEVTSIQSSFLKAQGSADASGILRIARWASENFDPPSVRRSDEIYLANWLYVIMDWVFALDRTPDVHLALADEIAEEFGWPATLAGFSRKDGFPPEDEARRMAAWQTWLDAERAKWKPET